MNDQLIGAVRGTPLHAPEAPAQNDENTFETSLMKQDAAAHIDAQVLGASKVEDYTISVEQVREHFNAKGLRKSKDTVQRWCRTGDLDCQKRGVLGRYFTTETSLLALEQKLLPDMIAENAGAGAAASPGMQPDDEATSDSVQVDAGVSSDENIQEQRHAAADADEQNSMQVDAPHIADAHNGPHVAELKAQVDGLTGQLEQVLEMNRFLRDEIVSARGQRGDVVKIAEQMLGTLETIAVGGRLEKPKPNAHADPTDPVRYQQGSIDPGGV